MCGFLKRKATSQQTERIKTYTFNFVVHTERTNERTTTTAMMIIILVVIIFMHGAKEI